MKPRVIVALSVALLSVSALAQTADAVRYTGEVTGSNVYVRSQANTNAYPVTKLSAPTRVEVVGRTGDWLKILPPPNAFSVVEKSLVTPAADGKTGRINKDKVWARAGGELFNMDRHENYWVVQVRMDVGTTVAIIGQGADFYKITPPEGAVYYVSAQYVRRLGGEAAATTGGAAEVTARPLATTAPAEELGEATVTVKQTPGIPMAQAQAIARGATTTAPAPAGDAMAEFKAAEDALQAEYKKPESQRNLGALLARYKAIKLADKSPLKPYVEYRIAYLDGEIKRGADRQTVESLLADTARKQKEYDIDRTRIEVEQPTSQPIMRYAAEGILTPSDLFTGNAVAPKRYVIRDRYSKMVNAYVQCTTGAVDLSLYAGKHVGIFGATCYDTRLALNIIEAQQVTLLDENVQIPTPPRAEIKAPAPAPTPGKPVIITLPAAPAPGTACPPPSTPPTPEPATQPAPEPAPAPAAAEEDNRPVLMEVVPATQPGTVSAPVAPARIMSDESPVISAKTLPPTGLPMAETTTRPAAGTLNDAEF